MKDKRELARLILEKVMGWRELKWTKRADWEGKPPDEGLCFFLVETLDDMNFAIEVMEEVKKRGIKLILRPIGNLSPCEWYCGEDKDDEQEICYAISKSAPMAVYLAALEAVGEYII